MMLIKGLADLTKYLKTERNRLASAPILLIASAGGNSSNNTTKTNTTSNTATAAIAQACQRAQFLFQQKLGFRTVVASCGGGIASSRFPTRIDVEQMQTLASRIGATTVVAVGSGMAMDIAKALYQQSSSAAAENGSGSGKMDRLVLLPSTPAAAIAAASSGALLLDPVEETLILAGMDNSKSSPTTNTLSSQISQPTTSLADGADESRIVALMDHPELRLSTTTTTTSSNPIMIREALYACLALALDTILNAAEDDRAAAASLVLFTDCVRLLERQHNLDLIVNGDTNGGNKDHASMDDDDDDDDPFEIMTMLLQAGRHIRFGDTPDAPVRSLPIALAAALLPLDFSKYRMLTFLASLAPALFQEVQYHPHYIGSSSTLSRNNHEKNTADASIMISDILSAVQQSHHFLNVTMAPRAIATTSIPQLISRLHDNQAVWGCQDVPDAVLQRILQQHVIVP